MHFLWMRIKPSDLNMMDTVYNCKTAQFAEISANFGSRAPNGCGWATSGFKMATNANLQLSCGKSQDTCNANNIKIEDNKKHKI